MGHAVLEAVEVQNTGRWTCPERSTSHLVLTPPPLCLLCARGSHTHDQPLGGGANGGGARREAVSLVQQLMGRPHGPLDLLCLLPPPRGMGLVDLGPSLGEARALLMAAEEEGGGPSEAGGGGSSHSSRRR